MVSYFWNFRHRLVRYYWYIYILYYITYIIIEWFPWIRPWLWSISQVLESVLLFTPKIAGAYGCSSPVSVVSWPLAMLSAPPNGRRPGRRACRARRARARHMGSNGFAKKHTHEKKKNEKTHVFFMSCFTAFHVCLMLHGFFHIPWVLMMCFSPIDVSKSLCWIDFGTTVFFGALVLRVPHCSTYYQGLLYNYILYIISYRYDWWLLGMTNIILGKK